VAWGSKTWGWLLPAVVLAGGLTACGSDPEPAEDARVLEYWAVNMGPTLEQNTETLETVLEKFTDETGIEVDLEVIGWESLLSRVMNAVASGQGPDVLNVGNTWSPTLQDSGAFMAFDEQAMAAIGGEDRFLAPTMTSTGRAGEPPATIPYLGQAFALYYNTRLFAEAGIEGPPETWSELVADAKALTGDGRWGIALNGGGTIGNAHLAFLLGRQHGAELFTPDGEPQFDTQELRAAVRTLIDLMATDEVVSPSDAEQSGITDSLKALADGRAAMVTYQSSGRSHLASAGFEDYAVAPLPVLDPLPPGGAPVRGFVGGTNLAVLDDTQLPDEALELVRFLVSDEEQVTLNEAFGTLPVVHGAYDDPAFGDPVTGMFGTILSEHSETLPMVATEGQMELFLGAAVRGLWAKAATSEVTDGDIADALAEAERQMPR